MAPLWRRKGEVPPGPLPPLRAGSAVALAFLLLTPTLHPWYALVLVALLPFADGWAGLALSGAVFLGYHVLLRFAREGKWVESDAVAAAIFAAPVIAFVLRALVSRVVTGKTATANAPAASRGQ